MHFEKIKVLTRLLLISAFAVSAFLSHNLSIVGAQQGGGKRAFLPIIINAAGSNGFSAQEKLLGIYMEQYWTNETVATYMGRADSLAGKKHSISGWFIGLQNIAFTSRQPDKNLNNFSVQLEALWEKGYISFVNISSATQASNYEVKDNCPIPFTADQVAKGNCDAAIQKMADLYSSWVSRGGGRRAFIAPFPEMNGVNADGSTWTTYSGNPTQFKAAYRRFVDIFTKKGIKQDQIWWVFAPNGWSASGHEFEKYYPGDDVVDVVGFSSYNYGYCHVAKPWERWENYTTLYEPYINRFSKLAPEKPVIVAQTGTTAEQQRAGETNANAKNAWLRENYAYLSKQPNVLGVLYFDIDKSPYECNWGITNGGYTGYREGVSPQSFRYLNANDINNLIP